MIKYLRTVQKRFEEFDFPLVIDKTIIPEDESALFISSGIQKVDFCKNKHGSLQSCLRTADINLVGDGKHLTYFEMLGNFSIGGDYEELIELWHLIMADFNLPVTSVHVHPDRIDHKKLWQKRNHNIILDKSCIRENNHCCEIYCGNLKIGNLIDCDYLISAGFGWERWCQIIEKKEQIHQSSLFLYAHPFVADHYRALLSMKANGIRPGSNGRSYFCKRLIRRMLPYLNNTILNYIVGWIVHEKENLRIRLPKCRVLFRDNIDKSPQWWWETLGLMPEELQLLRKEYGL